MLGFRIHHPFQGPLTHHCDLEAGYGGVWAPNFGGAALGFEPRTSCLRVSSVTITLQGPPQLLFYYKKVHPFLFLIRTFPMLYIAALRCSYSCSILPYLTRACGIFLRKGISVMAKRRGNASVVSSFFAQNVCVPPRRLLPLSCCRVQKLEKDIGLSKYFVFPQQEENFYRGKTKYNFAAGVGKTA